MSLADEMYPYLGKSEETDGKLLWFPVFGTWDKAQGGFCRSANYQNDDLGSSPYTSALNNSKPCRPLEFAQVLFFFHETLSEETDGGCERDMCERICCLSRIRFNPDVTHIQQYLQ